MEPRLVARPHGAPWRWRTLRRLPGLPSVTNRLGAFRTDTRTIAAPILNADGKPIRRNGGAIVRSDTEREANPSARFLSWLTDVDLACMIGYPDRGTGQTARDRVPRQRAREALLQLATDGVIDLDEHRGRFRIFGPIPSA